MTTEELRESLLAAPKNGYARITAEQKEEMNAYCKRYMDFMDVAKTEREATTWAIAEAEKNGFVPFVPGMEVKAGDKIYYNCRDKAIAICQGKAEIGMCLPYLKEKAESFSDTIVENTPNGLIVLNEKLEVQQINAAQERKSQLMAEAAEVDDDEEESDEPTPRSSAPPVRASSFEDEPEQREEIRRFVICPKCGEKIWL